MTKTFLFEPSITSGNNRNTYSLGGDVFYNHTRQQLKSITPMTNTNPNITNNNVDTNNE